MPAHGVWQFGGVASAHVDYDLAPFVRKSYYKHFADGLVYLAKLDKSRAGKFKEEVENICLDDFLSMKDMVRGELRGVRNEVIEGAFVYAMDMLEREGAQAFEALIHNLNTLESRAGSQVEWRLGWQGCLQ